MTAFAPPGDGPARDRVAAAYRWYAEMEAARSSPLFAAYCRAVAHERWLVARLAELPPAKWQPNLLIAAVRFLYGTPPTADAFLEITHGHWDAVAGVVMTRSTQTNEPARCATLLPLLARLPGPLALLEVGASAGLCLLPDRYSYDYGRATVAPSRPTGVTAPRFVCAADEATPLPAGNLTVAWRHGLDLHPVDLHDDAGQRWLEALVWPGQTSRLVGLRAALEVARRDPPTVTRGDLRRDLLRVAAGAPADATLVVFHTAVLAYVSDPDERAAFADAVAALGARWVANERPSVIPGVPDRLARDERHRTDFLLCLDGQPVAWTDGHGAAIRWLPDPAGSG
jgi:hypothetical protein